MRLKPRMRRLPAVDASFGVTPHQAAKSRAEPNRFGNIEPDHAGIHLDGLLRGFDISRQAWRI
jgi:hypothetical protein